MSAVSLEDRFLFDLQGILVLRQVLSPAYCQAVIAKLEALEAAEYPDLWKAHLPEGKKGMPTKFVNPNSVRMNGLLRLDPIFDELIDHPEILPRLQEFMGEPQLINTWSIAKSQGCPAGGWHRGVGPTDYSCRHGAIRSRMLNVIFMLVDNGPDDGGVVLVPGSHKNNIDLEWHKYPGLQLPGSQAVTGRAGDVLLMSEAIVHNGLPKTTPGIRRNLYFNYVHEHYNVGTREPGNVQHFYLPPPLRARFTPQRLALTRWMEHQRWDH
jgi:hypothetical protein